MDKGSWDTERTDGYNVNFKGRRYKNCTPTDLDWVFEIKNKVLILAEVKRSEKKNGLNLGQKILAQNICSYISKDTIPVFFFYVVGVVNDELIEIENSTVVSVYSNITNKWEKKNILFKDAIDLIIKKYVDGKS